MMVPYAEITLSDDNWHNLQSVEEPSACAVEIKDRLFNETLQIQISEDGGTTFNANTIYWPAGYPFRIEGKVYGKVVARVKRNSANTVYVQQLVEVEE